MFSNKTSYAFLLIIYEFECIACLPVMPVGDISSNYMVSNVALTWKEAFVACKQNGMELASITTAEEQKAVAEFVASYPMRRGGGNGFWIAAIRSGGGNSFVWFTTGKPVIYSKFSPGQPDNAGQKEGCVEFFKQDRTRELSWNDVNCNHKAAGYICQHEIRSC